jgi:magnesium-transporting ATPase (P-type)
MLRAGGLARVAPAMWRRELRDSSHQLVMITGDAPLTACHAARRIHIVDRDVLIAVHRSVCWQGECCSLAAGGCAMARLGVCLRSRCQRRNSSPCD